MGKRGLQITSAVLAAIPVLSGIVGMSGISDPLYASVGLPPNSLLDSNLRFFNGVWLGLGVTMYCVIPNIEKKTGLFRALWGMIFIGGIGRLISMMMVAPPPVPFIGFTVLEIVGAPLFILWQRRVARPQDR